MKRSVQLLFAVLAFVAAAAWVGHADQPVPVESSVTAVTETSTGYRVYLDPSTGEITKPAASDVLQIDPSNRSHEGLVIEPSPVSGVMIDLQGRFQETMAVTAVDGQTIIGCGTHESLATNGEE